MELLLAVASNLKIGLNPYYNGRYSWSTIK